MVSDDETCNDPEPHSAEAKAPDDMPPIVAIGASAGGLEALQEFVEAIPDDSGVCYVVIQHLAPDHDSIMDELLASHTPVEVKKIEDGARPQPNTVLVNPPGPVVVLDGGALRLREREAQKGLRTPIDQFFRSVAASCGRDAICVVLSGTGSDGTEGLRAVKSSGGMAIVQKSDSARFPGMPDSAAATGLVDFVLKPKDMAVCIAEIIEHRDELDGERDAKSRYTEIEEHLDDILDEIAGEDGPDFGKYKPGTLVRRIDRRMLLRRQRTAKGYLKALKREPDERNLLLQDFLIGVTRFFRDVDSFAELVKTAIKPLVDSDQDSFRIWTPGCSTGEEAYTLAIIMIEAMQEAGDRRPVKIFGTDIDLAALRHARAGHYNVGAVADLSEERRDRFFRKDNGRYRVTQELRDCVVFAPHNLVEDPPFSRLDLITCRNLLIYLNNRSQANVIPRFHYALNPGGYLMLGSSESLGEKTEYFKTLDRTHRIFQRNDSARPGYSALHSDRDRRRVRATPGGAGPTLVGAEAVRDSQERKNAASFAEEVERKFQARFAPAYLVADRQDEVLYLSDGMTCYVRPRRGAPSTTVDAYLSEELRLPVQTALTRARRAKAEAYSENVVVQLDGAPRLVDVVAAPMDEEGGRYFVILRPVRVQDAHALETIADARKADDKDLLEHEISRLKQQLSTTLVEYEGMEQELRTTNEELLSMNEELQSSNEELETSREELQSINEELETINAELTENNRQLGTANSDLQNLFESTDVATLFLNSQMCVRLFTPKLTELFGVRDRDIGRPITDLASKVHYEELEEDAREVTRTLQPLEREVETEPTGEVFIVRVRPYRTVNDKIDGCVVTFFDITQRKRSERQLEKNAEVLARQYAELESLYDTTPVGLNLLDRDLRYLRINSELAAINGFPAEEHIGKTQDEMLPEIDQKVRETQLEVLRTGEPVMGVEVSGRTPASDEERHWIVDYYPVKTRSGEVFAIGSAVREVTAEVRLRAALQESEARLRRLFDSAPAFIALHEGSEHKYIYFNPALHQILGERELLNRSIADAVPELKGQGVIERYDSVCDTGEPEFTEEFRATILIDGKEQTGWYRQVLQPWYDAKGAVGGVMSFAFDISDIVAARKHAENSEERKDILLNELQHRVKNTLATTLSVMRFTARAAADIADMTAKLEERITAISRTHDTLTQSSWAGDHLLALCDRQISPYADLDGARVAYEGDDPFLDPKQALALGLALHELTTNAVKHGALKTGEGKVVISVAQSEGEVRLRWIESGVGAVAAPDATKSGFGSFLLNRVLKSELGGNTKVEFGPDGLVYDIRFPAARRADTETSE
ncbi:MAG: CheR family methyltransferase [Oceanicaulis sp.]